MVRPYGAGPIALQTDDHILAGQLLRPKHFTLFGEGDLKNQYHYDDPFDPPFN